MQSDYSSTAGRIRRSLRRIVLFSALSTLGVALGGLYNTPPSAAEPPLAAAVALPGLGVPLRDPSPEPFADLVHLVAGNDALSVPAASTWQTLKVRKGENLSGIFADAGLPADDWVSILKAGGDTSQLHHLRVGEPIHLHRTDGQLDELTYALDETRTLDVRRGTNGFQSFTLTAAIEHRSVEAHGVIENSLFADGEHADLSDRLIMQFATIFNYDIDFAQDLQPGDSFSIVYDTLYKNGKKLRDGDVLAAEFINQGHRYRAVRYVDKSGDVAYYTPQGQSMRKAFIRTPVDFARISSGFSLARWHPILNIMRAHKGVDYAAPMGTPVKATGDGRIEFRGQKSGYGNVVMIRHGEQIETVYAHMSRFQSGEAVGSKVHQGDVIGYVGMTGLATAPHLHYEFRVNGVHQNPVTVALPRGLPIFGAELTAFRSQAAPLVARLDSTDARYASAAP